MADLIGQRLGNYRLLRLIGRGGFADVYLAEHIHLGTQAAIKVLQVRLVESNRESFLNEARTIAHLVHPSIVRVLDFGVQNEIPFLVMDYAPRGTFRQRFLRGMPLPAAPLVPYVKQVAAALQYGHDRRLIHRDVKPENILLGPHDEILLSDFGFALIAHSSTSRTDVETAGTAAYMAPEQLQGKPCPASDQYALGTIAYEWLSGSCPFQGNFFEVASQQVLAPPPPLQQRVPTIAPQIVEVVMKALEKDPRLRFPNVQGFALALEEACLISKQYAFNLPVSPQLSSSPNNTRGVTFSGAHHRSNEAPPQTAGQSRVQNSDDGLTLFPFSQQSNPSASRGLPLNNQPPLLEPAGAPPSPSSSAVRTRQQITSEHPPLRGSSISGSHRTQQASFQTSKQSVEKIAIPPSSSIKGSHTQSGPTPLQATHPSSSSQRESSPKRGHTRTSSPASRMRADSGRVHSSVGRTNLPGQPLRLVVIGLVALLLLGISAGTYSYITNTAGKGTAPVTQSNAQQNKLSVQATPTSMVAPTATPTANPDNENPYPPHGGTFVMNEPLDTNHYGWQETPTTAVGGACQFVQGGYQAYDPIIEPNPCFAYNTNFINFAYQIDVKFLQTGQLRSGGGILFRGNSTSNKYYFFELYSTGQYSLQVCNGGDCNTQLAGYKTDNQALNAFRAGLNVTNTLAVVAVGTKFDLYLNQQLIKEVVDPNNTYMIGMVGVMVSGGNDKEQRTPATSTPTRAVFSNARVWKL